MMAECELPSYKITAGGVSPSAPPTYENLEPDEGFVKPPSAPPLESEPQGRAILVNLDEHITEEDVQEACAQYVSEHCCYGKKAVRDMELKDIKPGHTFHYKLETFGEKRESVNRTTPYHGQNIDGPENGPAPDAWNVHVPKPTMFKDSKVKVEFPHTAVVKRCSKCNGACKVICSYCYGFGKENCTSCSGRGTCSEGGSCSSCSGSGSKTCWHCHGRGRVKCNKCDGHGKMKHYRLLIATWKNHVDDYVSDTLNLPKDLILKVAGKEIFREENVQVYPITHAPDVSVNAASNLLLRKHHADFPLERIIMQRHNLQAVPLTKVNYSWKSKEGEFYIYGFERKVYFKSYPQKCCCCTCF